MSNTFATNDGQVLADVAAGLAETDMGLAALIYRDVAAEFVPGRGNTVSIRVPGVTTTATRSVGSTADYEVGEIVEQLLPVTLTTEAYSVVPVSLAESTLDITSYAKQVLKPQTMTVAHHIESVTAAAFAATPKDATIAYSATDPRSAVIHARAALRARGVSADANIRAVAGANVFADLLLANALDDQGSVAGVKVHESNAVPVDALYVFVPGAFVAAIRAPLPPEGATVAASATTAGMALTHMRAFNGANGTTNSIVTTFVGVAPMPLPVADYENGVVDLVEGGGIVSIDTTP